MQSQEETLKVVTHIVHKEVSVVETEVEVPEIREHSHDLIQVTEGSQERADMWRVSKGVEKLKFIGNAMRRGRYIDLLKGNELWLSLRFRGELSPLCGWCIRINILH